MDKLTPFLVGQRFETINVGNAEIPIDHTIATYRYIYYGLYEEHLVRFLKRVIKGGDVVIEPGVNIGYVTAILSGLVGPTGRVIGLEPSRICFQKIRNYIVQPNVLLLNSALADRSGAATFIDKDIVISHGYSTLARFGKTCAGDDVYEIAVETVDGLCVQHEINHIRFLKLDIEGAEFLALQGARQMLGRKAIDYVLVETTFSCALALSNRDLHDYLIGFGYLPYVLTRNSIKPVNITFLANTRKDIIWTHLSDA